MISFSRFFSFVFALMLVVLVASWFIYTPDRLLEEYKLETPLKQLKKEKLEKVLAGYIGRSFWQLDIEQIHADLVHLDWVYQAEVSRKWPSSLTVKVVEQIPAVRWGEDALLNQNGDIFYPHNIHEFKHYVQLKAENYEAKDMLKKLSIFQTKFSKLDWVIKRMTKQVDKGWLVEFVSNQQVIIGRAWPSQIDRFIFAFPKVKKEIRKNAQTYDLRYSNGFVVKEKLKN